MNGGFVSDTNPFSLTISNPFHRIPDDYSPPFFPPFFRRPDIPLASVNQKIDSLNKRRKKNLLLT
jgi:hypothetical protein